MSSTKKVCFYLIVFFVSFLIAIIVLEIGLRFVSLSSGTATGKSSQRWFEENWKPINKLGYRDVDVEIDKNRRHAIFLGDSFTAGHGVKFDETFFYKAKILGGARYQYISLGQNGTSTIAQTKSYNDFVDKFSPNVDVVVHQYFGNDIDDYIKFPRYQRSDFMEYLMRYSDLAEFIDNLLFIRNFGERYLSSLFSAYSDSNILERHLKDLGRLHEIIRKDNARLVFIVFPFLNNDTVLEESQKYILPLVGYFNSTCKRGDVLVDVSSMALKIASKDRVVNFLDSHPSPLLHNRIAETVNNAIVSAVDKEDGVHLCLDK